MSEFSATLVAREPVPAPVRPTLSRAVALADPVAMQLPAQRLQDRERGGFRPSWSFVALRTLTWLLLLLRFALAATWDGVRRRGSRRRNAVRLREMMQRLGATAIKIGQQMSVRTDVLAPEYCEELDALLDQVPPFPFELAKRVIEEDTGGPLARSFRAFETEPIGSGSIACVFRAELHSGERVAVKIRRPEIGSRLTSDMNVLIGIGWIVEALGFSRTGKWSPVLLEIKRMLLDELDFILEARQIEAFRRDARSVKHLSAPRVHFELTNARILVTEFIDGIAVKDLIEVVADNDLRRLSELKALGYDPVKISKRWIRAFFWQVFEAKLFHADPHPANLIIRPGNEIVIIDFGSCGNLSSDYRRNMFRLNMALIERDQYEAVHFIIASAEPLPPINVDGYTAELQSVVRKAILATHSKHAPWQEKTSGGVWREVMDVARAYDIPLRADALRYFRANILSESMAYRLYPELDPVEEFRTFSERRAARLRKQLRRQMRRGSQTAFDPASFGRVQEVVEKGFRQAERSVEQIGYSFRSGISKASYALGQLVKGLGMIGTIFLGTLLVKGATGGAGSASDMGAILRDAATVSARVWFWLLAGAIGLTMVRKIMLKVGECDVEEKRR